MRASTIVLRGFVAALLCAVLAGCAGEAWTLPGGQQTAAIPPDDAADEAAAVPADWPRPPLRPAAFEGFSVDPETLLNLEEDVLRAKMGEPAHVREEPPAMVWTYAQGDCRLDLYLYQSVRTREMRSLTYVLEAAGVEGDPAAVCLRRDE